MPRGLRARAATQYHAGNLAQLTDVMTAWSDATSLGIEEFAARFFGLTADDPVVLKLHDVALDVALAMSPADLQDAAEKLAEVVQIVGIDS